MYSSGAPSGGDVEGWGEGSDRQKPGACSPRLDRGLARAQRVSLSRVFREAFEQSPRRSGKFMSLWLWKGEGACLRLGVVASKRSFPRAVDRGRAKRRLREAYRLNRFRFRGAYDVILVARSRISSAKAGAIEEDLLRLVRDAGLISVVGETK